jgi:hypothetical protein
MILLWFLFSSTVAVVSLTGPSSVACGATINVTWLAVTPTVCKLDQGFAPHFAFSIAKRLASGASSLFAPPVGYASCNQRWFAYKFPTPLQASWHTAGGGSDVGRLTFRIVAAWADASLNDIESITPLDVTLTGACRPTVTATPAPRDCVLGAWSSESVCSSSCGAGTRTRTRIAIANETGACERANCGVGCIAQVNACDGARDNPLLCRACADGSVNCRCRSGGVCNSGLACVSNACRPKSAPPLGCENCECKPESPPCEYGLTCTLGRCLSFDRGCPGCVCEADDSCDLGLVCAAAAKTCVFASTAQTTLVGVDQCDFGTKDCPCLSDNACSFGELTCRGGFCREDRIEDATTTAASEEEDGDGGGDNQTAIIVGASVGVVCCVIIAAAIVFGVLTMARRKQESVQIANSAYQSNRPSVPVAYDANDIFAIGVAAGASGTPAPAASQSYGAASDGYASARMDTSARFESEPSLYPSSQYGGSTTYPSTQSYPSQSTTATTTAYPSASYPSQSTTATYPSQRH